MIFPQFPLVMASFPKLSILYITDQKKFTLFTFSSGFVVAFSYFNHKLYFFFAYNLYFSPSIKCFSMLS